MVVAGDNKSTDDKNIDEVALQFVVRTLEHRLQPLEGCLENVENSLQSIQTSMATIIQSLSKLGLDPL